VRRPNALALVPVLQHVDAVLPCDRLAHEIPLAGLKALPVRLPPALHLLRVGPHQPLVRVHLDVLVLRVLARARFEALRLLAPELQRVEVGPGNQREGLTSDPGGVRLRHQADQPWDVRRIASDVAACNQPPARRTLRHALQHRVRRRRVECLKRKPERALPMPRVCLKRDPSQRV
jgi:hypothetical protein